MKKSVLFVLLFLVLLVGGVSAQDWTSPLGETYQISGYQDGMFGSACAHQTADWHIDREGKNFNNNMERTVWDGSFVWVNPSQCLLSPLAETSQDEVYKHFWSIGNERLAVARNIAGSDVAARIDSTSEGWIIEIACRFGVGARSIWKASKEFGPNPSGAYKKISGDGPEEISVIGPSGANQETAYQHCAIIKPCDDLDEDGFDICSEGELGDDGRPFDCDDNNVAVHPGMQEITDDGIDNNCDGEYVVSEFKLDSEDEELLDKPRTVDNIIAKISIPDIYNEEDFQGELFAKIKCELENTRSDKREVEKTIPCVFNQENSLVCQGAAIDREESRLGDEITCSFEKLEGLSSWSHDRENSELSYSAEIKVEVCPPDKGHEKTTPEEIEVNSDGDWNDKRELFTVCHEDLTKFIDMSEDNCKDEKASKDKYKTCLMNYILEEGLGLGAGFMKGYFAQEISCNGKTEGAIGYTKYCSEENKNKCSCIGSKVHNPYLPLEYNELECRPKDQQENNQLWITDGPQWKTKNSCGFETIPAASSLLVLGTGTCQDYSFAATTLLRMSGFKKDEIYSVSNSGHAYNIVKKPGEKEFTIFDTTGNSPPFFGFENPPKEYCEIVGYINDFEKFGDIEIEIKEGAINLIKSLEIKGCEIEEDSCKNDLYSTIVTERIGSLDLRVELTWQSKRLLDRSFSLIGDKALNGISDLDCLTYLRLIAKEISDISALSGLKDLDKLELFNNKIRNLDSISGLTELLFLDLQDNQISDINALSGLKDLDYLNLRENAISDISALDGLNLVDLFLSDNAIEDISSLENMKALKNLYISNNQISDVSALSGLKDLDYLDLRNNQISDINALKDLEKLEHLWLGGNQIMDVSTLKDLEKLEFLTLSDNQISDISALSGLRDLDYLDLRNNQISDISPLKDLGNLESLPLNNNQIMDVSALKDLEKLEYLDLSNNPISFEDCQELINHFKDRGQEVTVKGCPSGGGREVSDLEGEDFFQFNIIESSIREFEKSYDLIFTFTNPNNFETEISYSVEESNYQITSLPEFDEYNYLDDYGAGVFSFKETLDPEEIVIKQFRINIINAPGKVHFPISIDYGSGVTHSETILVESKCNQNNICEIDKFEDYENCPNDCPTGSLDGKCDLAEDGIADPDCLPGSDDVDFIPETSCNGQDDNSNGLIDEGCDDDGDFYYNADLSCDGGFAAGDRVTFKVNPKSTVSFKEGWNLVAFPVENSIPVEDLRNSECSVVGEVRGQGSGAFLDYEDIDTLEKGKGYIVFVRRDCEFDISPYGLADEVTIGLENGWNLVSGPDGDPVDFFAKKTNKPIWRYDADRKLFRIANNVNSTQGLWVEWDKENLVSCNRFDLCDDNPFAHTAGDCGLGGGRGDNQAPQVSEEFDIGASWSGTDTIPKVDFTISRIVTDDSEVEEVKVVVVRNNETIGEFEMENVGGDEYSVALELEGPDLSKEEGVRGPGGIGYVGIVYEWEFQIIAEDVNGNVNDNEVSKFKVENWLYQSDEPPRSAPQIQCSEDQCAAGDKCIPKGFAGNDSEGNSVYCELDGSLNLRKAEGESCDNNYECLGNLCSNGECIGGIGDIVDEDVRGSIKLLCRILHPISDEAYEECLETGQ